MDRMQSKQQGKGQVIVLVVITVLLAVGYVALDKYTEGESYEVLADVTHREVFGDQEATLVIGRRAIGRPLPALPPSRVLVSLR